MEAAISGLRRSGNPALSQNELQLADLVALQRGVATADPAALAALSSQIAAVAASATAAAQDAIRGNASSNMTTAGILTAARDNARRTVDAVMAGMKDFDPYLKFASPEDERAYREREHERKVAIDREQVKGTPQGELNATGLARDQLVDAGQHGADKSPDFKDRISALDATAVGRFIGSPRGVG